MKKILLMSILTLIVITKISLSTSILVDVNSDIKTQLVYESQDVYLGVVNFSSEVYNTGSVPYSARVRVFVYDKGKLIFSGWSQESALMPGDKKTFSIYWHASSPGTYESKLRIYYGNEIYEDQNKSFQINDTPTQGDAFEIDNLRTYDSNVVFDLKSSSDASNVIVVPMQYMPGWIFEQKVISSVDEGAVRPVSLNYYPTFWEPTKLKLAVMTADGRYYSEKIVELSKEYGITSMIYSFLDGLKLLMH